MEEWNNLPVKLINSNTVELFLKELTATLRIGDKLALSFFPRVSHRWVAS